MSDVNNYKLDKWEDFFVEKTPRQVQRDVMAFLIKNWSKYDNFIINAPTGTGKSSIALTIARTLAYQVENPYSKSETQHCYSYITTTSIELQNQYDKSYSKFGLKKLYSASNFTCTRKTPLNCAEGKQVTIQLNKGCPNACPYDAEKSKFLTHPYGIMNLQYFLYETHFVGALPRRGVMIFDEAHNIGDYVKDFVTIIISEFAMKRYGVPILNPLRNTTIYDIEVLKKWLVDVFVKAVNLNTLKLEKQKNEWKGSFENKDYLKICSDIDSNNAQIEKVNYLFTELNPIDWVAEKLEDKICITPISPRKFMNKYLIGKNDKNIFMSATIFDKNFTMEEYGLDPARTCFFSAPSPFPKENRPVYVLPTGKLEYGNIVKSMQPFTEIVKEILKGHQGERGIIFVSSYTQANELIKQVNDERLITHTSSKDKIEMMNNHIKSMDTVIVSPSMHEGVDLKGDLSRFQVILKIPFPSLGSQSIKRRAEIYPEWYAYTTILTLIQSTGRSIRSETDVAATYILDSNFTWFYKKWEKFFPKYWKDSIIYA